MIYLVMKKMEQIGIVLTIVGGIMMVVGMVIVYLSFCSLATGCDF
jgi:uncharacterized protein YjeT (DUF2065 family)